MNEATRTASLAITADEHAARRRQLLAHAEAQRLHGVVVFDPAYILYYTGFAFIQTERPMAFVMNAAGECAMFVPRLESEHARAKTGFDRVDHYVEYPDDPHPMEILKRSLAELGIAERIGADTDGYPWVFGYRGPSLTELSGAQVVRVAAAIEEQMMIKSDAELALIREGVRWGNRAHELLQQYTRVGASETDVSMRASHDATREMLDTLGGGYRSYSLFGGDGASAGYRGQIGRQSAIPHALSANIVFEPGDVLVTGAAAPMWGYHSELERTMVVGEANDTQRRLFDHMVAVQDLAMSRIRPGVRCADVDRAVREYFEAHGLRELWKHHTGHCIGLRYHEGPFLDVGDPTEIRSGMVFTVEPGLYQADVGGFRHSDTVVVTADGLDNLTADYPRDLARLTIPV